MWKPEMEIVSDDEDDFTCADPPHKNVWLKKKSVHELV